MSCQKNKLRFKVGNKCGPITYTFYPYLQVIDNGHVINLNDYVIDCIKTKYNRKITITLFRISKQKRKKIKPQQILTGYEYNINTGYEYNINISDGRSPGSHITKDIFYDILDGDESVVNHIRLSYVHSFLQRIETRNWLIDYGQHCFAYYLSPSISPYSNRKTLIFQYYMNMDMGCGGVQRGLLGCNFIENLKKKDLLKTELSALLLVEKGIILIILDYLTYFDDLLYIPNKDNDRTETRDYTIADPLIDIFKKLYQNTYFVEEDTDDCYCYYSFYKDDIDRPSCHDCFLPQNW